MTQVEWFETKEDLARAVVQLARPGDLCWFKASRGMALEDVIGKAWDN